MQMQLTTDSHTPPGQTPATTLSGALPQSEAVTPPQQLPGVRGYICVPSVAVLATPNLSFDACRTRLSYGTRVTYRRQSGTWIEIESSKATGWVPAATISATSTLVLPQLCAGVVYGAEQRETKKLRACIQDSTMAGELRLPLQDVELALYHLWQSGYQVSWSAERPRIAGRWHQLLRGVRNVSMGIEPRTNAIMEYHGNGTPGFLAVVRSVTPAQHITLATVGRQQPGEYLEEEFSVATWREWRPVFISFG